MPAISEGPVSLAKVERMVAELTSFLSRAMAARDAMKEHNLVTLVATQVKSGEAAPKAYRAFLDGLELAIADQVERDVADSWETDVDREILEGKTTSEEIRHGNVARLPADKPLPEPNRKGSRKPKKS